MPSFTLAGVTYEYLTAPKPERLHLIRSGTTRPGPVEAAVQLADGGTVTVYGQASRWSAGQIQVRWQDDEDHFHAAWLPTANVRRLTASEWDIIEFHNCPENLRHIQWGKRLPGFLPE
ncbi:hypothetical protein PP637_gp33 [Arthrobacter phage Persistence]|uniref:Uncharacterized protein n=1 Tax=Arthrobacter phage Persistence TaxID=2836007 RepID=A0A8F3E7T1_9CAUD|nr:hypothetical protein PP637_gp33 [Arthrobacter phage Persistence]QWY79663.1 hypothetical protein SEA_PERSISTENCE_33 [Arthrobacter phage Persistence]